MFCRKCGTQLPDDSVFCQKCGTSLIVNESASQTLTDSVPTVAQEPAVTAPESTVQVLEETNSTESVYPQAPPEDTSMPAYQQAPPADTPMPDDTGSGLGTVAMIGRVVMGVSLLLLLICAIFSPPINPIVVVFGIAIGTILSALGLKRPLGMTKVLELAVAGFLLIAAIVYAVTYSGGDKYVRMVKGGTLEGYPQKTVGEAFDGFLSNPKWESGLAEDNTRFVNVKGKALYLDKEVTLVVQFFVDEANETFSFNAVEMNDIPQNNLFFWGLLEAIYNDSSAAQGTSQNTSQDTSSPALVGDRITVGKTQSYDVEGIGKMEVRLDYVEFVDKFENELHLWNPDVFPKYTLPDEGNLFLRATLTVKNIGTENGQLLTAWNTVVYDGEYEFRHHSVEGDSINIKPLTAPTTTTIIFEVPNAVAESDGSLVLNINDITGEVVVSYAIRTGTTDTPADQGTSDGNGSASLSQEDAYDIAQAWLDAHPDMRASISGAESDLYQADGEKYYLFYLGEMYYANLLVNSKTGELSIMLNYDGEYAYSEIEPLDDYYNRYYQEANDVSMQYRNISIGYLLDTDIQTIHSFLGKPTTDEYYQGGRLHGYGDEISFVFDEYSSKVLGVFCNPAFLVVDGVTLDKTQGELIDLLGNPVSNEFSEMDGAYILSFDFGNWGCHAFYYDLYGVAEYISLWSDGS